MKKKQLVYDGAVSIIAVFFAIVVAGNSGSAAQNYPQVPIVLDSRMILPEDLLKGENYQIQDVVKNDGAINTYELITDYGPLTVESTAELLTRIDELRALVIMEKMDRGKVFGDAVVEGVKAPVKGVANLVKSPIKTTTGIVKGTGRFFSNVGRSIFSADPDQDNVLKVALGYDVAKRGMAFEMGINPYTNYDPVVNRLGQISRAAIGGGLAPRAAMAAIDHDVVLAAQTSATAYGMLELVRDKSPGELNKINRKKLEKMGIDKPLINAFLENYRYNPQERTLVVGALETMQGVSGLDVFISRATLADAETVIATYRLWAQMIAGYHNNVEKIAKILNIAGVLTLQRKDGGLIIIAPADYLFWTRDLEIQSDAYEKRVAQMQDVTGKEIWLSGKFDQAAVEQVAARGWKVQANANAILLK